MSIGMIGKRMTASGPRTAVLIVGDIAALYLFALIGRRSHGLAGEQTWLMAAQTALPFAIAWLGVSPWFGMFEPTDWRNLAQRMLISWPLALLAGMVLRTLVTGSPLQVTFILVALLAGGGLLATWRMIALQLRQR